MKKTVLLLLIGAGVGVVFSLVAAQQVKNTSKASFCASCHEMKPMYETWLAGPHGPLGNDAGAVRATCVDCHLKHNNVVVYLFDKTRASLKDVYGHYFKKKEISSLDFWLEKLEERENYTYEENCRRCHRVLPDNVKHKEYEEGKTEESCLDCHHYVGHGFYFKEDLKSFFETGTIERLKYGTEAVEEKYKYEDKEYDEKHEYEGHEKDD